MATLVLAAAGTALGGALGGSVLGLSTAVIGRAVGAAVGQMVDQRLFGQGAEPVATGKIDRLHLTAAGEGAPLAHIWGRMRVAGQVIWAGPYVESTEMTRVGGGKGAPHTEVTSYSYRISLALALCHGVVRRIGRVWADGVEIARDDLGMVLYTGTDDQTPDPVISAHLGEAATPAYRGIAYVVLADLDLGRFGNRIPQFTFEVMRPADQAEDMGDLVKAVALIPGTGEYALSTTPAWRNPAFGERYPLNTATIQGKTDLEVALDDLTEELPQVGSVSLVVSWFGDDLRLGACKIRPRAEYADPRAEAEGQVWQVAGLGRAAAGEVARMDDAPVYGGTPDDAGVIEAIRALHARGQKVMFYPFILMDQLQGNSLPDPYGGTNGQAALPWRGRITLSKAPDQPYTPDGTSAATAEVAAFFGTATRDDFTPHALGVTYSGPEEWSLRRMILHYAHLCAVAGGVEAFCIGSELRGVTTIRDDKGFPAVDALIALAEEVRAILPATKITYAADWSEYHGMQPHGSADKIFHLDPLWAHPAIDMVGIDNYLPLSDWRDGTDHRDASWGDIHALPYVGANVAGGEYYDWYYHSPEAVQAQNRSPITDGLDEPWIWRTKDLRGWWGNRHYNRIGGTRAPLPTAWVAGMKPIWFTEMGCAALDKGTNEPNRFLDPKSSESGVARASHGGRDDLIQLQYLRAMIRHFAKAQNNPQATLYEGRMVDMDHAHVWAWDARPYPTFPARNDLWSDAANYACGHWLNGRASNQSLDRVIAEICHTAGVHEIDVSQVHAIVRGYRIEDGQTARAGLQPLLMAHNIDVAERDGVLHFRNRRNDPVLLFDPAGLARDEDDDSGPALTRAPEAEIVGRLRLTALSEGGDYSPQSAEAILPDTEATTLTDLELPLVLTPHEMRATAARLLANARAGRDTLHLSLPRHERQVGAGDLIALAGDDTIWRIERIEDRLTRKIDATRIATGAQSVVTGVEEQGQPTLPPPANPIEALFLDLPPLFGQSDVAPFIAATATPWPRTVALLRGQTQDHLEVTRLLRKPALIGTTQTPLPAGPVGRWHNNAPLRLHLSRGSLGTRTPRDVLAGLNMAALGVPAPDNTLHWEVIQFQDARLVGPQTWEITRLLRGQAGSEALMPDVWPIGTRFVLLDPLMPRLPLGADGRHVTQHLAWGPAARPLHDRAYRHAALAFAGAALRPFAPCHFKQVALGGDLQLSWTRRSRIGGDGWEGAEVPLSETREAYLLRVFIDGRPLRQVECPTPRFTYSAAAQAADWAGAGVAAATAPRRIEVSQISDAYGPGPALSCDI